MVMYGNELLGGFFNATEGVTQTTVSGQQPVQAPRAYSTPCLIAKDSELEPDRLVQLLPQHADGADRLHVLGPQATRQASAARSIRIPTGASMPSGQSPLSTMSRLGKHSQSYSTSLTLKRFSFSGSYGKADGISILTATGLDAGLDDDPDLTPLQPIVFNGKSYSFGGITTRSAGWFSPQLTRSPGAILWPTPPVPTTQLRN